MRSVFWTENLNTERQNASKAQCQVQQVYLAMKLRSEYACINFF